MTNHDIHYDDYGVATVVDVIDATDVIFVDVDVIFVALPVVVVFSVSPLFLIFMSSSSPDVSGSGAKGGGEKDVSDEAGFPTDEDPDDDDPEDDEDSPDDDPDAGSLI